jgi:hypothetical protein
MQSTDKLSTTSSWVVFERSFRERVQEKGVLHVFGWNGINIGKPVISPELLARHMLYISRVDIFNHVILNATSDIVEYPALPIFTPAERAEVKDYNKAQQVWKIECGKACQLLKDSVTAPVLERLIKDFPDHVSADERMVCNMWRSLKERYGSYTRAMDMRNINAIRDIKAEKWSDVEAAYVRYQMLCRERATWSTANKDYDIRGHEKVTWILELLQGIPDLQITLLQLTNENAKGDGINITQCIAEIEKDLRDLSARNTTVMTTTTQMMEETEAQALYSNGTYKRNNGTNKYRGNTAGNKVYGQTQPQKTTMSENIVCWKCGLKGHKALQCYVTDRTKGLNNSNHKPYDNRTKVGDKKRKWADQAERATERVSMYEQRAKEMRKELTQVELAMSECYTIIADANGTNDDTEDMLPYTQDDEPLSDDN